MKFNNPLATITNIQDMLVIDEPEQPTFKDSAKEFAKEFAKNFAVSFVVTFTVTSAILFAAANASNKDITENEEPEKD